MECESTSMSKISFCRFSFASENRRNNFFGVLQILFRPTPIHIIVAKLEHPSPSLGLVLYPQDERTNTRYVTDLVDPC